MTKFRTLFIAIPCLLMSIALVGCSEPENAVITDDATAPVDAEPAADAEPGDAVPTE